MGRASRTSRFIFYLFILSTVKPSSQRSGSEPFTRIKNRLQITSSFHHSFPSVCMGRGRKIVVFLVLMKGYVYVRFKGRNHAGDHQVLSEGAQLMPYKKSRKSWDSSIWFVVPLWIDPNPKLHTLTKFQVTWKLNTGTLANYQYLY